MTPPQRKTYACVVGSGINKAYVEFEGRATFGYSVLQDRSGNDLAVEPTSPASSQGRRWEL